MQNKLKLGISVSQDSPTGCIVIKRVLKLLNVSVEFSFATSPLVYKLLAKILLPRN